MSHVHSFFIHTYQFCFYHIDIKLYWFFSACFSLSLSLSFNSCSMASKQKSTPSQNSLHFGVSSSSPSADPTPSHVWFRDDKARKDFSENFHDASFIRNAKSFYQIFPILTFPLSSIVGVGSHYVASWSPVLLWSYKSFTITCTDSTILYLNLSLTFEIHAL